MLLHGAGKTKQDWYTKGYVDRLREDFTVITVDIRGMGESDHVMDAADYTIDKLCEDLCVIADTCGVQRFAVWGYSLGGNIARHIATKTDRVTALVVVGAPLGNATDSRFDQHIDGLVEKWRPIVKAYKDGMLSDKEQEFVVSGGILVWSAFFAAMRTWPVIEPKDIQCPALLVVGTEDNGMVEWVKLNRETLEGGRYIKTELVEGINHDQEFTEIDKVFPQILSFLQNRLSYQAVSG